MSDIARVFELTVLKSIEVVQCDERGTWATLIWRRSFQNVVKAAEL